MLLWLRRHVRDFDVVHVHALFSFAPVIAALCARRAGVPYVISPHGVLNVWGRENRRRQLKSASIRWVEAPLLRDAAAIQFTSRLECAEFSQLGIRAATVVIPLALTRAADAVPAPADRTAPELLELSGRPLILFLARIHPIKNLDMLLRAFVGVIERHSDAVLLVAGDGETSLVAGLRLLAQNLGIEQHVRWVGFADADMKRWLLERADLFVLPSWSENFGLAAAEAMSAGIPVIVTRGVGIADIVAANDCGLVTECSEPALREAIESLLDDEAARVRMGRAGRRAAREELSLETYAGRLDSFYRSAANARVDAQA
jgi:glycosyltransferase involved in cell wall biosynthesis